MHWELDKRREEGKAEESGGPDRPHTLAEVERLLQDAEAEIDRGEGLSFPEAFGEDL